ncbi:MAG: UDP-3-O-(3-hydroxymyristoyl)glucosamine N-acyltransferase [Candidatus Eremiobacteraeota bacterium]|nr:UDP-3-O-(3-hydroxymyristoyl)glucosamine N-acyltransferase [Candidatus Eremiobacteraeota bacterium]MBV9055733.1 UDP-3-O-(3-hydroxymyristoyl)glucosamine N-acyltransferase [Candidatus Eremiobacteraeota bacterium]MBV9699181.1 UDP-3-O-(3-hydroxymyristoyl)glucosamine N-acyltransferase [Candidatus Eremiobacteraeota bacterium]
MLGTLDELAGLVHGRVIGDGSIRIERIATVEDAVSGALTFATSESFLTAAMSSPAAAILVPEELASADVSKPLLVVADARLGLARLLTQIMPPRPRGPFRHASAVIESDEGIAADVYVGALAYIGNDVRIGAGTVIGPHAFVGDGVTIGENAWVHSRAAVLRACRIGNGVVLHAGCVIGSDGFGWAFVDGEAQRIPQIGNVELEDGVEIGANTCIDRAQIGSTRIGAGTKIDNLVQVGHNCRIGKHCVIAALTGLAGSTIIGDCVRVAGQVGFRGHLRIGSRVTIAGGSGVWNDVDDDATISGNPARHHRDELRQKVMLRKLPKLFERVEALERSRPNQ